MDSNSRALRAAMERLTRDADATVVDGDEQLTQDLRLVLAAAAQQERDAAELGALRELEKLVRLHIDDANCDRSVCAEDAERYEAYALDRIVKALDALRTTTPMNQCDGCRRGLPLVDGIHKGEGYDMIACTAGRYTTGGQ